ncbi:MAG TPA: TonB-dependent receptor [Alphaproteobacteria bacterium]|nr:TonB-dependent receptor [Alphaproteobacteria bacterium]
MHRRRHDLPRPTAPARRPVAARRALTFCLAACGLAVADGETARAEDATASGSDYVVTATRVPTDPARIASSVTVVTAEEIEQRQYQTVVDVLEHVPGIHVAQAGGRGTTASIFSRGTESNHTLFLINGIRAQDPSSTGGIFQFESLDVSDIERVEIVRGAQSVLYGSDAIGAVINIITKKGGKKITASGSAEGGSFSSVDARTGLDGSYKFVDFNLHANRFASSGLSILSDRLGGFEQDPYKTYGASARLGLHPADWFDLDLFGKQQYARTSLDTFVDDPNAIQKLRQNFGRVAATVRPLGDVWTSRLAFNYNGTDRSNINTPDATDPNTNSAAVTHGDESAIEWQNDVAVTDTNTVTLGIENRWERGKSAGDSFFAFSQTDVNKAAYLQDQFALWDRVFGTVGVRVDKPDGIAPVVTYRVAPTYVLKETETKLKATYGTGFKQPSLEDKFGFNAGFPPFFPAFFGNPNLKPERSTSWDAGFEQALFKKRVTFGATYFHNKIKDLITTDAAFTTTVNLDRAKTWGAETFVTAEVIENVTLSLNYTYLRAEDEATGAELARRPRNSFNADITYRPVPEASVTVGVATVGHRTDIDFLTGSRVGLNGYTMVRAAATYDINQYVGLFGRLENVFDKHVEDPDGFRQPGFAAYGGIKLKFSMVP